MRSIYVLLTFLRIQILEINEFNIPNCEQHPASNSSANCTTSQRLTQHHCVHRISSVLAQMLFIFTTSAIFACNQPVYKFLQHDQWHNWWLSLCDWNLIKYDKVTDQEFINYFFSQNFSTNYLLSRGKLNPKLSQSLPIYLLAYNNE